MKSNLKQVTVVVVGVLIAGYVMAQLASQPIIAQTRAGYGA